VKFTLTQSLPESEWRRFVDEHPQGNIFHTPEMFQVFAQAKGHRPTLWAAVDSSDRLLALLLPVEITLMDGLLRRFTTRAVAYGSVLCAPGPEGKEALAMLLDAYNREIGGSVLFTELRNLSELEDIKPILHNNDFVYEDHLNFIVDLRRPVDEMWNSLDRNARSNVKKARRKGVIVEEASSLETVQVAYNLLQEVYGLIQAPLADFSLFQAAFEVLQPRDMARFFMARVEDVHIGTSVALLHKDVIYGWYAGAIREYSSYKAGDLLNWHALEWGNQNGFRVFDFGGAGKPDEDYGPRKFKAKFGGTLVNYGRNTCIHAPVRLKLSQAGYQLVRRVL
jgi:serine/alanine adding enzyme